MSKVVAVEAKPVPVLENESLTARAAFTDVPRSFASLVPSSRGNAALQRFPELFEEPPGVEAFLGNSVAFEARPRANLDNLAMLEAPIGAARKNPAEAANGALVIKRTDGGYEVELSAAGSRIEFLFDRHGHAPLNSPEELRVLRDTITNLSKLDPAA